MSDIKQGDDGVAYFDITMLQDEDDGEAAKSLRTPTAFARCRYTQSYWSLVCKT
jgi:hypothetical protein